MNIRTIHNTNEVLQAFSIEIASYPPEAAATHAAFLERFRLFRPYFFIAEQQGNLVGVANGVRLHHDDLSNEGMKQMSDYCQEGPYFCLLTVAVSPEYRRAGIGAQLLGEIIRQAQSDQLEAVLLLCEEHLIPFYERAGFRYLKPSSSIHGGITWHEMRLNLI